jgi:dihydroxy-acid dehydratase
MPHPYDRPTDPAKRHSAALTDGPDRAGARGMLKAIGFTDEDLARPIIGVATQWIETMPCNYNQRELAAAAKEGIRAAGGTPMEFNTISVSDGVTMGTEGMKASLVSREVIADSIELVTRGHLFDGLVCLTGCDKTSPAAAMAMARLDIPAVALYNGTILPGHHGTTDTDVVSIYEAIGSYRAGKITLDELYQIESTACPGPGACGGQYTANTMSMVLEFLGLSPAGLNGIPAPAPEKLDAARRTGELVMDLVRRDVRPSHIVDRNAIENAIASIAATGGSTNGVLHLLAIAHEFGIPLAIDDFDRVAERTPLIADLRPGGRYRAADLHAAGGIELVMRELVRGGKLHAEVPHRRRTHHRGHRRLGQGDARPGHRAAGRPAHQAHRRPGRAAGHAGAGRLRHQAGRSRTALPPRTRARVRFGDGVLRGGQGAPDRGRRRGRHPL